MQKVACIGSPSSLTSNALNRPLKATNLTLTVTIEEVIEEFIWPLKSDIRNEYNMFQLRRCLIVICYVFSIAIPCIRAKLIASKLRSCAIACCLSLSAPAFATNLDEGEKLFSVNCAFCHPGGGNVIPFQGSKTLKMDALSANGVDSVDKISNIIYKGKGQMPAFGPFISPKGNQMPARLDEGQIADVAEWLLYKANKGW